MRRVVAVILAAAVLLTGCTQPDLPALAGRLRASVFALPGVTGGTVDLKYAALSPNLICDLTGSGTTQADLIATMDAVLRTLTDGTRALKDAMVSCSINNGDVEAGVTSLGFQPTTTLTELRKRYP